MRNIPSYLLTGAALAALVLAVALPSASAVADDDDGTAPKFRVVPGWPKPLPNNWLVGQVGGIAVDRNDNIWIVQRPRTLTSDEAGATDAVALACADGPPDPDSGTGLCEDGNPPTMPVDTYGHERPAGPLSGCCFPAPSIMQFDPKGNLLQAWGGPPGADPRWGWPAPNCLVADGCEWPAGEHGIYVDHNDNVYLAGNGNGTGTRAGGFNNRGFDGHVLKFASDGTFLLQIGKAGPTIADSNDTDSGMNGTPQLYRPADMEVDPTNNELYIADGYGNHRVVVVDAATGMYKRHWGAYGQNPVDDAAADAVGPYSDDRDDGVTPANFRNPVHCVRIARDGMVYVCDRVNDRLQEFDKATVGLPCDNSGQVPGLCGFLRERTIRAATLGPGSVWDLDTSADWSQSCLHNVDGTNQHIDTLDRASLDILATFGRNGRSAGQFHWVHNLAIDSKGNMYTAEVDTGKRAQKFKRKGSKGCDPYADGDDDHDD
ncbi:MAG: hypothetical protein OEN55_02395 [Alphaproteobacteria bacterium]|nr:hypothetical protein [Alphaproteobacteria bacterium]